MQRRVLWACGVVLALASPVRAELRMEGNRPERMNDEIIVQRVPTRGSWRLRSPITAVGSSAQTGAFGAVALGRLP